MGSAERIGIFGGSFDPVHLGHLALARAAREAAALNRVLFVVANRSPLKPGSGAPPEERLAMVRLAVEGEAGLEACDLELHRPAPSYTIDTIRELRRLFAGAELRILLGSDSLGTFPRWREAAALVREAPPIVVPRRNAGREALETLRGELGEELAAAVARGWIEAPLVDVSSSELRRRLEAGEDVSAWLPPAVAAHIVARGLYRGAPGAGRAQ